MQVKELIWELLFPSFCLNCQKLGPILCQNCYHDLNFYFTQNKIQEISPNFEKVYFDQLQIMAKFEGSLAQLLKALKYQSSKNVAPFLAQMLYRHLLVPQADLITFVPLHPHKLKMRGYNQCQEIALELGKIVNIPVKNLLQKKQNTSAQAQVKKQKIRLQRMQGLFQIRERYKTLVIDKRIIVIDDVLTTGATLNAVSQALKNASVKEICGLIVASKME